jgi:hypothetical protein
MNTRTILRRGVWLMLGLALLVGLWVGCSKSPTSPDLPSSGEIQSSSVTQSSNPVPAAAVPGESFEFTTTLSSWTVKNLGVKLDFKVCGYTKIQPFPGLQRLVYESGRFSLNPGETASEAWPGTPCGWQIDMIDWRQCPKEGSPPTFGGGSKAGFHGGDFCPQPTPTPSPTPSPTPTPKPSPSPTPSPSPSPSPSPTPPPQCKATKNLGDKNFCLTSPLGNPETECAYFGLSFLSKDDDLEGQTVREREGGG